MGAGARPLFGDAGIPVTSAVRPIFPESIGGSVIIVLVLPHRSLGRPPRTVECLLVVFSKPGRSCLTFRVSTTTRLFRPRQLEEQLDKELRFHLEQHAADLMARGCDPTEARRQARLALGGPEQVKEGCRDARGTRCLEDLWQPDWHALLFALGVSLISGLLFGLAPALRVPARDLAQTMRAGARNLVGSAHRLHGGFVISEIALAIVLLISAGNLGRTLLRLSSIDTGVDVRNVLTARTALSPATLASPALTRAAWQEVLERARRVPGVQSAAVVDTVPLREGNNQIGYWTTPAEPPDNQQPTTLATCVTPDYLKVMGIVLRQGRFFTDQDRMGNEAVVVIDEVLAQEAFGGRQALGERLWIGMGTDPLRVVGVVGHVRHWGPAGDDKAKVRAQLYYPFAQLPDRFVRRWSELMSIAVRAAVPPLNMVEPLRREARGVGGDQVLYEVQSMDQIAGAMLGRQRFLLLLFGIFAGLALLLACIGIYGVLAYVTSRRVPEIGVRMALGATARDCMRLVLRQSLGKIFAGAGVGLAAALVAARLLERLVEGVRSTDPLTFATMISVLVLAALFASFLPARRASRVDPMSALRQD